MSAPSNRWVILAILFFVRTTMAFQFQAVAALSPLMMTQFAVGLADIGMLIGLYLLPGVAIAFPSALLARAFGDRRLVLAGLALMVAGGIWVALGSSWEAQLGGRLLAGVGGVIINLILTKLVTDYFTGREISTAMAVLVNSWPVGIALALVVLPSVAATWDLALAMTLVAAFAAVGLVLLFCFVRETSQSGNGLRPAPLRETPLVGMLLSGSVWGLYNAGLPMVFAFGPALLVEQGYDLEAAASLTSLALWALAISIPLGGYLADRSGKRDGVILFSLLGFALLLALAPAWPGSSLILFIAIGLVGGLAPGPIMSLPSSLLTPRTSASGMGIFFTVFYLDSVLAPIVGGWLSDQAGTLAAAFYFGAAALVAATLCLLAYRRLEMRARLDRDDRRSKRPAV